MLSQCAPCLERLPLPEAGDAFNHPTGRSSSVAAADLKPVLVELGDGMPTCRTAKSKGCPIIVQQSEEDA
jgi:hypothetical protein